MTGRSLPWTRGCKQGHGRRDSSRK